MPDNPLTAIKTAAKLALRITTDAFDTEIEDLISAAIKDIGLAGVTNDSTDDPLVRRAVITYVKLNFGQPDDYDKLKASYDEQKAQMGMATNYTAWGDDNG